MINIIEKISIVILLLIFVIIYGLTFVSADIQLPQYCGGDDEMIIGCFGDQEINPLGETAKEGGGGTTIIRGEEPKKLISEFLTQPVYLIPFLVIMFGLFLVFILITSKRNKKEYIE